MTDWPSGKELSFQRGVIGMQIEAENPRQGHVDDGLVAYEERIEVARRHWHEAKREDFERGRRGRWTDKATGVAYREFGGCGPDLNPTLEACDLWFVESGRLVLLVRAERHNPQTTVVHGEVISRQIRLMARQKYTSAQRLASRPRRRR